MTTPRLSQALLACSLAVALGACSTEAEQHEHDAAALAGAELPPCCEVPSPAEAIAAAGQADGAEHADAAEHADGAEHGAEAEAGDEAERLADLLGGSSAPEVGADGTGLPDHGLLPEFSLMADDASSFGRDDLLGDLWVVDFIFTRCAGPCPAMSRTFVELQDEDLPTRFLSVTVDPAYDSPAVLSQYRTTYGADADDWRLLTGSHDGIQSLADSGFRLPVNAGTEPVAGMPPMFHSGKFALVDRQGHVRGYYAYTDELELQALRDDIATLAAVN